MFNSLFLVAYLVSACGGSSFSGGSGGGAQADRNKGGGPNGQDGRADAGDGGPDGGTLSKPDNANGDGGGSGSDTGDRLGGSAGGDTGSNGGPGGDVELGGVSSELIQDGELIACPNRPQKILILDFKSGWWAGDGGDFFEKVLGHLHKKCPGEVQIEYHHLLSARMPEPPAGFPDIFPDMPDTGMEVFNTQVVVPGGTAESAGGSTFDTAFGDKTFKSYSQIWLLSGAKDDPADMRLDDPFFQKVMDRLGGASANVFIGAGYGSIVHANPAAAKVGIGQPFATQNPEDVILSPTAGVEVITTLEKGDLANHVMFSKISSIADDMRIAGVETKGDAINPTNGLAIIAKDHHGQGTMAATKADKGGRRVVLDANLPRYYAVWQDKSDGTLQLLQNLIVFLSK